MHATHRGGLKVITALLVANADPDLQTTLGRTALWYASGRGYLEVVKLLLRLGADPDLQATGGVTALTNASTHGHLEIVKALIAAGANLDGALDNVCASCSNRNEIIKVLKEAETPTPEPTPTTTTTTTTTTPEPTPTTTTTTTTTPEPTPTPEDNGPFCPTDETFNECLIIGSKKGNINKVREALNNKADVDHINRDGRTALWQASGRGYLEICKAIIETRSGSRSSSN